MHLPGIGRADRLSAVPETKSFLSSVFFGGPNVAATVDLGRLCSVPKNKFFLSWGSLGAPNVTARTMLNTDSFVLDLIGATNVAADILLRTMLNSGYVVLNGLVASLVAAVFHYPLQEFIHITTHRYTVHHHQELHKEQKHALRPFHLDQ